VNSTNTANLFEVDQRTVQRDISDIRCYFANGLALYGDSNEAIVYNRSKGGYEMQKIA
jgi:predicted DNA-binding transcriptional regulator YafY